MYKENRISEFIRKTEFRIDSISKKREIKAIIDTIKGMSECAIDEVINFADEKGICRKDDKFKRFVEENEYLFNRVRQVNFQEFQNLYEYLEGHTPFSTQHKIKGAEYDNVFVILDNGSWSKYNFARLFGDGNGSPSVLVRTKKIFYVCCTRAKENLIVFYHDPSPLIIRKAKEWFGEDNVCEC